MLRMRFSKCTTKTRFRAELHPGGGILLGELMTLPTALSLLGRGTTIPISSPVDTLGVLIKAPLTALPVLFLTLISDDSGTGTQVLLCIFTNLQ